MSATKRRTRSRLPAAEAVRSKPALVIAHDLAAFGAAFQIGRHRRRRHSQRLARGERFGNSVLWLRVLKVNDDVRLRAGDVLPLSECNVSKLKPSRPFTAA